MIELLDNPKVPEQFLALMGTGARAMRTHPEVQEIFTHTQQRVLQIRDIAQEMGKELVLISGLAEGWDEAIATIGLRNEIKYVAMVPHPTYGDYYWGRNSITGQNRLNVFKALLEGASEVRYTSNGPLYAIENGKSIHVNFIRNQHMINVSNRALVYDPTSRGTRDAVARMVVAGLPMEVYPFF